MSTTRGPLAIFLLCIAWPPVTAQGVPPIASFHGLGGVPEDPGNYWFRSRGIDVTPDGSIVVGSAYTDKAVQQPMIWTAEGGAVTLGDLPGGDAIGLARAISHDGLTIAGCSGSDNGHEAFVWTAASGMVGLGDLPGGIFYSDAYAMSADGSIIVGGSTSGSGPEAFRWTQESGIIGLGDLPQGDFDSIAYAITPTGDVIVGNAEGQLGVEAAVWVNREAPFGLGELPGGNFFSSARGVSDDGSVVVGWSENEDFHLEATRWTEVSGVVGLGHVFGQVHSYAKAVSGDGSIVVGYGYSSVLGNDEAIIWDEVRGIRRLQDVLEDNYDLDLGGWFLTQALGISEDGQYIVGEGLAPDRTTEGWIVFIPKCEGDANKDYVVDPIDAAFVLARMGCPAGTGDGDCDTADQNGDGVVDPLDSGYVLSRFGECP